MAKATNHKDSRVLTQTLKHRPPTTISSLESLKTKHYPLRTQMDCRVVGRKLPGISATPENEPGPNDEGNLCADGCMTIFVPKNSGRRWRRLNCRLDCVHQRGWGESSLSSICASSQRSMAKRISYIPADSGLALKTVISTRRLAWRASLPLPAPLPVSINFCCPRPTMWIR